ncbi:cystathionine beta-lyase [Salmonella enterica subsp. enterica]|uniref:Cystathionine beta-lyase n=1 Tax=Salmonella enterica I TaxID=59201 RepID=A0A379W2D1_SALET|nr:cystathionine beta-lyase [Salmonella enterica subsp. enterica]
MEVHDIPSIVSAVRRVAPEAVIMIDNTWAAGVLFKALEFDIDISIQAGTKYLIGHSDAMVGTAVANARCWEQLRENAYLMGQMLDADTAYMTSRGLRTLGVRLRQHQESSLKSPHGWRTILRSRALIIRPCRVAKVMRSGNETLQAAAACSPLCSIKS